MNNTKLFNTRLHEICHALHFWLEGDIEPKDIILSSKGCESHSGICSVVVDKSYDNERQNFLVGVLIDMVKELDDMKEELDIYKQDQYDSVSTLISEMQANVALGYCSKDSDTGSYIALGLDEQTMYEDIKQSAQFLSNCLKLALHFTNTWFYMDTLVDDTFHTIPLDVLLQSAQVKEV